MGVGCLLAPRGVQGSPQVVRLGGRHHLMNLLMSRDFNSSAGGSVFSPFSSGAREGKVEGTNLGKLSHTAKVGEKFNGTLKIGKRGTLRAEGIHCGTFQNRANEWPLVA